MERLKFGEKKDLLMIPNIQANLKHSGGNVMGLGLSSLLLGQAH